jgi:DNA-binding NarL/FixJ family response regulator
MHFTVAIVDDHTLIAKALTEIIGKFSRYEVLYDIVNGQLLLEKFKQKKNIPDIVLLDVSMPIMDGFETAAWLKKNHPEVYILALSMQDDEQSLIKMIKNGAHGYLLKNIHPAELEKALDTLLATGHYFPDWATAKIMKNISGDGITATPVIELTDREKELLQYVCTEMTYREIGEKMFCSSRTVESYRDSLFEKLNLKTRVGLAVYALKNGFCKE